MKKPLHQEVFLQDPSAGLLMRRFLLYPRVFRFRLAREEFPLKKEGGSNL